MVKTFKDNVLLPLSTRLGTAASLWLTGYGVAHDQALVTSAVTVALGVGIDLMLAWFRKRSIQRKAVQNAG